MVTVVLLLGLMILLFLAVCLTSKVIGASQDTSNNRTGETQTHLDFKPTINITNTAMTGYEKAVENEKESKSEALYPALPPVPQTQFHDLDKTIDESLVQLYLACRGEEPLDLPSSPSTVDVKIFEITNGENSESLC